MSIVCQITIDTTVYIIVYHQYIVFSMTIDTSDLITGYHLYMSNDCWQYWFHYSLPSIMSNVCLMTIVTTDSITVYIYCVSNDYWHHRLRYSLPSIVCPMTIDTTVSITVYHLLMSNDYWQLIWLLFIICHVYSVFNDYCFHYSLYLMCVQWLLTLLIPLLFTSIVCLMTTDTADYVTV